MIRLSISVYMWSSQKQTTTISIVCSVQDDPYYALNHMQFMYHVTTWSHTHPCMQTVYLFFFLIRIRRYF